MVFFVWGNVWCLVWSPICVFFYFYISFLKWSYFPFQSEFPVPLAMILICLIHNSVYVLPYLLLWGALDHASHVLCTTSSYDSYESLIICRKLRNRLFWYFVKNSVFTLFMTNSNFVFFTALSSDSLCYMENIAMFA